MLTSSVDISLQISLFPFYHKSVNERIDTTKLIDFIWDNNMFAYAKYVIIAQWKH